MPHHANFPVGIEDWRDLLSDFEQALERVE